MLRGSGTCSPFVHGIECQSRKAVKAGSEGAAKSDSVSPFAAFQNGGGLLPTIICRPRVLEDRRTFDGNICGIKRCRHERN